MSQLLQNSGRLIALSWAFLAIQVSATDYGTEGPDLALGWLLIGSLLLLLVHRRRSRIARGLVIVPAMTGAIGCAIASFTDGSAGFVAVTFLGQALPLLTPAVRRHVQRPAADDANAAFRLSKTASASP
jgi:peptidoglycan/LPS O-acetylase OafA/YrhL